MYSDSYLSWFESNINDIKERVSNQVANIKRMNSNSNYWESFSSYKYGNAALKNIEQYKTALQNKDNKDTIIELIKKIKSNYDNMNAPVQLFERDYEVKFVNNNSRDQPTIATVKSFTQSDPTYIPNVIASAEQIYKELAQLWKNLEKIGNVYGARERVELAQKNLTDAMTRLTPLTPITPDNLGGKRKSKRRKSNKRRKSIRRR